MNIQLTRTSLDQSILPKGIYGDAPFRYTNWSIALSSLILREITMLLRALLAQVGVGADDTYFRIDAYFDPNLDRIWVLEVSSQYVDGWGIALNLARAAGRPIHLDHSFPSVWVLDNPSYLPEIELDCREIAIASDGIINPRVVEPEAMNMLEECVYWYGWRAPDQGSIGPAHGRLIEDKIHLARVSKVWIGEYVHIPKTFVADDHLEELDFPMVLKNRRKNVGVWGNVVFLDTGDAASKRVRQAYRRGEVVAQKMIEPYRIDGRPTQIEILCIGTKPVAGYLLYGDADTRILNDRVEHGPLFFLP